MELARFLQTTARAILSGSAALLALLAASCTSTGTGPDGKPLQMSANTGGSIVAETLQSAADQTIAAGTAEKKDPSATKPEKTAEAAKPEASATQAAPQQIASAAQATDAPPETQVSASEKPVKTAFVAPPRPTASEGSIKRLFSDNSAAGRADSANNARLAVAKPVQRSLAREYNYVLPGVRPNGGFEIKHRKSLDDDSDIDANEDDESAGITYASAPGLARLAPHGLRVQRETVDVACLKPELVTMLRSMEQHFHRPVMVTSGYRSPSYNRKVNGAPRSLHMICAAADIQIDGVSKWEIARYARSMPGRGGVGTYCHTTSVHVDIGPERDWNWRCRS
ncbi:MAG: shikimate transporter [Rhizobiales bacterium 63-22]|mgnify:CR=1 FL=1|nr:MAG: shikimate transporter [Rhizobiales bacterium 63-22]